MNLSKTKDGDCLTVYVDGDIDVNSVRELKAVLEEDLENSANIILECGKLNYIDSTGIGVLVSALKKAQQYGGSIKINNLKPYLVRIFDITGLTEIFDIEVCE